MKLFQFISSEAMKLLLDLQGWIWLRQVFKQSLQSTKKAIITQSDLFQQKNTGPDPSPSAHY